MRKPIDNRHHNRTQTDKFYIDYKIEGSNAVYNARVINVGAGGMCFLRNAIIEKGDIIQIKFPFKTKKVILTGEIVRVDSREVGVKFIDDEMQIERFVYAFNSEFREVKTSGFKRGEKLFSFDQEADVENDNEKFDDIFDLDKE